MSETPDTLYEALERIFHEPNRLAIMSTLCAAGRRGATFGQIKEACNLTDGNLNRHLKVLEEADAVRVEKKFVDNKPRTTVFISNGGLTRFNQYLEALGQVLRKAQESISPRAATPAPAAWGQRVKA
jgi:DNA-binding transcriptional ArsR family regulator